MNFLICARGGSKEVKNKNLRKIKGKSLVERSLSLKNLIIFFYTDSKISMLN